MSRWEIRLSGFGGQGVVSAGYIIAKAAALYVEGKDAVLYQSYGPEKQGGWARADVVVADGEVDYPLVETPDIFVAMSQDGFDRDAASARPDATILIDERLVDVREQGSMGAGERGSKGAGGHGSWEAGEKGDKGAHLLTPAPRHPGTRAQIFAIPATEAAEALGRRVVANIVMLGAFTVLTGIVTPESMERAILETVPKGTEELNAQAFQRGMALADGG